MLTLEERLAVVNLYEELGSYRAAAAVVGCDHKTVEAVIERGRRVAEAPRWRRRLKLTDPFLEMVEQKVESSQRRIRSRPLGTARRECLDHLLIFGRQHLERVLSEFLDHYHQARPHQGLEQRVPCPPADPIVTLGSQVERRDRLGGLLHEYRRAA